MIITALKRQVHRRDRINVFLDDEYAFSLQELTAARLVVGQELTDDDVRQLQALDEAERGYSNALHYLSYRPRSEEEIKRYLERKGLRSEQIEDILNRLVRANLVDDQEFARLWVENREAFRPRGRRALYAELRQKGVDRQTIEAAIDDVDEDAGAIKAAESRVRRLAGLDKETFYQRLLGFLQRRGFAYDVSRRVTERFWHQVQAEQESDSD
jgi:regulatory protein